MASTYILERKNGTLGHKVAWREGGKQRSMTFDHASQAALLNKHLDLCGNVLELAEASAANEVASGPTLSDTIEEHIRGLTGIEERTRKDYRRDARLHINPHLGHIAIGALTRRQIRDWINAAQEEGAAPKSIANWHGLLYATCATAVDEGLRADNPCKGVRLPQRDQRDDHEKFMEPDEYEALLGFIPPHWRILVELLAGTGARWGEVTALRVEDLVLTGPVPFVRINKAWKRGADGRPFLSRPKTRRSHREITISKQLAAKLSATNTGQPGTAFLIRGPKDGPVNYNYFQGKVWTPAVRKALDAGAIQSHAKIHGLRHTHASILLTSGVDLMTVQRRLGHESITTSANLYGHLNQRNDTSAVDAIEKALGRKS